eukprot:c11636_g1_i1.p1 GENE.c11636_g1_i1~~c11636_g1_i1.p1  ORF type:complete len:809 (-),score=153.67 c11636_g1_i1:167-2566(-)
MRTLTALLLVVVALPNVLSLPREAHVRLMSLSNSLSDSTKTGLVIVPPLTVAISVPLADNQWFDSSAANQFINNNCKANNALSCDISLLDKIFEAGTKTCTKCRGSPNEYQAIACSAEADTVCANCTARPEESFAIAECTDNSDAQYAPCQKPCGSGEFQTQQCTHDKDRVCTRCTLPNKSQYISKSCVITPDGYANGEDAEFDDCTVCEEGHYELSSCGGMTGMQDRTCAPCSLSCTEPGTFQSDICTATSDIKCSTCSGCQAGVKFARTNCTGLFDTVCSSCRNCATDEFLIAECTPISDRECKKCTTDIPANNYIYKQCTLASDTQFATCSSECPVGKYKTGDCNWMHDITCETCSQCPAGKYASTLCNSTHNTVCSSCSLCGVDQYETSGGCVGAQNTNCSQCTECPLGFHEATPCVGMKDRACTECVSVVNAHFITNGSCEVRCNEGYHLNSEGNFCLACTQCTDTQYEIFPCIDFDDAVCNVKGDLGLLHYLNYTDNYAPGHVDGSNSAFAFKKGVLIAGPLSYNGKTASVIRVTQITTQAFQAWFVEAPDNSSTTTLHPLEYSSFLLLDKGWGSNYYVGALAVSGHKQWTNLSLPLAGLGKRPWIFPQIQTAKNGAFFPSNHPSNGFVKPRITLQGNSATKAQVLLESYEAYEGDLEEEVVGYLAINSGCEQTQAQGDSSPLGDYCPKAQRGKISINGTEFDYVVGITETSAGVNNYTAVHFNPTNGYLVFKTPPLVFASMQTYRGSHSAEIRIWDISGAMFFLVIEEDMSKGNSTGHTNEWVAWMAIGSFL